MSHTIRQVPDDRKNAGFRSPVTKRTQVLELAAKEELSDEDFPVSNRLSHRANPCSDALPTAWDDITCGAWKQTCRKSGKRSVWQ